MPKNMFIAVLAAGAAIGATSYLLNLPMTVNVMLGVIAGAGIVLFWTRRQDRER